MKKRKGARGRPKFWIANETWCHRSEYSAAESGGKEKNQYQHLKVGPETSWQTHSSMLCVCLHLWLLSSVQRVLSGAYLLAQTKNSCCLCVRPCWWEGHLRAVIRRQDQTHLTVTRIWQPITSKTSDFRLKRERKQNPLSRSNGRSHRVRFV